MTVRVIARCNGSFFNAQVHIWKFAVGAAGGSRMSREKIPSTLIEQAAYGGLLLKQHADCTMGRRG